jgi:hypothetical protein
LFINPSILSSENQFQTDLKISTIRIWLESRRKNGEVIDNKSKILPYDHYDTLLHHIKKFGEQANLDLTPKIFRKLFRTRLQRIIGLEAVCKMAAWTIPEVGSHYFLPSPEDCLQSYLQIEPLVTFESKAISDKEQQIQNLINFAIAQGLPVDQAQKLSVVFREKALSPEEAAQQLSEYIKQLQAKGGGRSFEDVAAKTMARILMKAMREIAEGKVKEESK